MGKLTAVDPEQSSGYAVASEMHMSFASLDRMTGVYS
jgi:hypothetical protein